MTRTIIDKYSNAIPVWVVDAEGNPVGMGSAAIANDRDVDGNPVPTNGCEAQNAYPAAANSVSVGYFTPALGLAATYSIPVSVYRIT